MKTFMWVAAGCALLMFGCAVEAANDGEVDLVLGSQKGDLSGTYCHFPDDTSCLGMDRRNNAGEHPALYCRPVDRIYASGSISVRLEVYKALAAGTVDRWFDENSQWAALADQLVGSTDFVCKAPGGLDTPCLRDRECVAEGLDRRCVYWEPDTPWRPNYWMARSDESMTSCAPCPNPPMAGTCVRPLSDLQRLLGATGAQQRTPQQNTPTPTQPSPSPAVTQPSTPSTQSPGVVEGDRVGF